MSDSFCRRRPPTHTHKRLVVTDKTLVYTYMPESTLYKWFVEGQYRKRTAGLRIIPLRSWWACISVMAGKHFLH